MRTFFLRALQALLYWEAGVFRSRYSGPVVVISGSAGKTSTKEIVALVLKKVYGSGCLVTPKSLNTEVGVPLTLLGFHGVPQNVWGWLVAPLKGVVVAFFGALPKCMVLEVGMDHPGDLAYLARLVRPSHLVITNTVEAHSLNFESLEAIQREEASLLEFLSLDGVAILNGDDEFLARLQVKGLQQKVLVRLHKRADYFASNIKVTFEGTEAILHHANRTQRIRVQRYGEHHLYGVLQAAAVADALGVSPSVQVQAFKEIKPIAGRGVLISGKHESFILDESYNASPAAMQASLEVLSELPAKRRIAILGDMRELKDPLPRHQAVGRLARDVADYVIAVGPESKAYKADEWFLTAEQAIPSALRQLKPGAIVLVKGSQNTIRLERVVKALMRNPEQASRLLVRQEKEWLKVQ